MKATLLRSAFAVALLLLAPAACDNDPAGLNDLLDVSSDRDLYTFELNNPGTYSGTTRHEWEHTGSIAELVIEVAATGGTGTVTIQDADAGQVLVQSLLEAGTFDSMSGRSGTWTITTILINVTGHIEYRIARK